MEQYMKILKSFKRTPAELEKYLRHNVRPIPFKSGDYIQKEGKICGHLYFIEKGIVRTFDTRRGQERTYWFKKENDFIIALKGSENRITPTRAIQAVEDVILWDFPEDLLYATRKKFDLFNIHFSAILIKGLEENEDRSDLMDESPARWLDYLRQTAPDLLDRVRLKYLASFIGVSEKVFLHMKNNPLHLDMGSKKHQDR